VAETGLFRRGASSAGPRRRPRSAPAGARGAHATTSRIGRPRACRVRAPTDNHERWRVPTTSAAATGCRSVSASVSRYGAWTSSSKVRGEHLPRRRLHPDARAEGGGHLPPAGALARHRRARPGGRGVVAGSRRRDSPPPPQGAGMGVQFSHLTTRRPALLVEADGSRSRSSGASAPAWRLPAPVAPRPERTPPSNPAPPPPSGRPR